jgi:hypothetical protein
VTGEDERLEVGETERERRRAKRVGGMHAGLFLF